MRAQPFGSKVGVSWAAVVVAAFVWLGCSDSGGGGSGGSGSGNSGAGRGGTTGAAGAGGTAGDAGTTGAAGTAGAGGTAGANGGGGTTSGGTSGSSGAAGAAGATGNAGRGGAGGTGGTAGGAAGSSGRGGAGGTTGAAGRGGTGGGTPTTVTWMTRTLSPQHFAEGADVGDINGDGVLDLVAGPNWYAGPSFALGGTVIANPPTFTMNQYSKFFLTFVDDVNGDNRPDVIAIGDAGGANDTGNPNAFWYQNPGPSGLGQPWTKREIISGLVANESPGWVNVAGDAKKELLFIWCETTSTNGACPSGRLGYARPGADPTTAWTFTPVGGSFSTAWVHGLGAGDVDGDGLPDVLERTGWWQQSAGGAWTRHAFEFWIGSTTGRSSNWGGSQMYAYDVDGDGDLDVVSALAAHQYGLAWFEHQGSGSATTLTGHQILPTAAGTGNFSQLHATVVADVNGDGLQDIITGKRYYAHPSTNADPGTTDAPVISWFELQRGAGGATFTQHVIHSDSGVGCNFVARDVTGDGKVDVFTTNKHGTFLHVQQ